VGIHPKIVVEEGLQFFHEKFVVERVCNFSPRKKIAIV
jgi:hypothetical protein